MNQNVVGHSRKSFASNVVFMIYWDVKIARRCLVGLVRFHDTLHTSFWESVTEAIWQPTPHGGSFDPCDGGPECQEER